MSFRTSFVSALLMSAILAFTSPAVAQQAPPAAAATPPGAGQAEYVVGPDDVIEIEVVGQPDRARAHVYADGTIQVNLLGKVSVAGRTTRQIGEEMAQALKAGAFYANPTVNVEVVSFASRYVTVLGDVGAPGLVPINRPYRLSEILAKVGGVHPTAADYLVLRSDTGAEKRYSIQALATGDLSQDPYVSAGDKIFSPVAEVFYMSGQIRTPGSYPLQSNLTIRQAIAKGGGLTESGTDRGVEVTRGGKKVKLDAGAKVEAGDVIVIRERLF
jgi:polysaccharide export outer membrane protein